VTPRLSDYPARISVFLSEDQHKEFMQIARKKGFTASALIRHLILEYLEKEQDQ